MTSLNPVFRIGAQVDEVIELHGHDLFKDLAEFSEDSGKQRKHGKLAEARAKVIKERTIKMLDMVGIANPEGVYQHVSARAFRRDAPARHDRNGPRVRAAAHHRG